MSDVEFLLVPISIILGLAFARLLEGLYIVSKSERRYWVHTVWLCNKLGQILVYFWAFRVDGVVGRLVANTDFGGLLLLMSTPTFIFLQALALVGTRPTSDRDWSERFYENRTRFFVLNSLMIVSTASGTLRFESPVSIVPFGVALALSLLALASANRNVHAGVACAAAAIVALGMALPIIQAA